MKSTTQLNALQGFALVYLFLTEGDGGGQRLSQINNLSGPNGTNGYEVLVPMFQGNGGGGWGVNTAIAGAITNFTQTADGN